MIAFYRVCCPQLGYEKVPQTGGGDQPELDVVVGRVEGARRGGRRTTDAEFAVAGSDTRLSGEKA